MPTLLPRRSRRHHDNPLSPLGIHNIVVGGHRTSVRLEPAMWDALQDVARRQRLTIHDLVTRIDRGRTNSGLTAAIRVYIVNFYRSVALHTGQAQAARPSRLPM